MFLSSWLKPGEKGTRAVIPNPSNLLEKLAKIKARKDLQIIADFDMTMTQFAVNGERGKSSHRLVEDSQVLSDDYRVKSKALFQKYYPIEIDPAIVADKKIAAMTDWWTQAHELMVQERLEQKHLADLVKSPNIALRKGAVELMKSAHEHSIPFHIFSAGLYDVIHAYINHLGLAGLGAHVVSNMMKFDSDGVLTGFQGSLIHTFNKNGAALKDSSSWSRIRSKRSVILLGDSLSDVNMAQGIDADVIVNVAFLNDRIDDRRADFEKAFDVVLLDDAPMDFVLEMLEECLS